MSASKIEKKIEYPIIMGKGQEAVVIEVGLRIPEQRRDDEGKFAPKREGVPGEAVKWAKSPTFKQGGKMKAIPTELNDTGMVPIPESVQDYFDDDRGLLMVKIVTKQPAGQFTAPIRYRADHTKGQNWPAVYDYDRVSPQRDNGDWVYSIPVHGLVPSSRPEGKKKEFFFFVARLKRVDSASFELEVVEVRITRGKNHYRVVVYNYIYEHSLRTALFARWCEGQEDLQDLPMAEVLNRYLAHIEQ